MIDSYVLVWFTGCPKGVARIRVTMYHRRETNVQILRERIAKIKGKNGVEAGL